VAARFAPLLALVVAACGGGGDDDGTGPGGGGALGPISASIDGQAWRSIGLGGQERATLSAPGLYIWVGAETSGQNTKSITMTLYNVRGPGTYPLGVNATTVAEARCSSMGRGAGTRRSRAPPEPSR
jgi:hypothetical protein